MRYYNNQIYENKSIIRGLPILFWGVIRIMAVYDEEGKDEDRVVFNLKTL